MARSVERSVTHGSMLRRTKKRSKVPTAAVRCRMSVPWHVREGQGGLHEKIVWCLTSSRWQIALPHQCEHTHESMSDLADRLKVVRMHPEYRARRLAPVVYADVRYRGCRKACMLCLQARTPDTCPQYVRPTGQLVSVCLLLFGGYPHMVRRDPEAYPMACDMHGAIGFDRCQRYSARLKSM